MCGIVGAIGSENIVENILIGLRRLEYRGYDSAGISVLDDNSFKTVKQEGKIINLEDDIAESDLKSFLNKNNKKEVLAIGHTRWATHGKPSQENSHPHSSSRVCVVHNGIIENYKELRKSLSLDGVSFLSQTDSEVIPFLFEKNLDKASGELTIDKIKLALKDTLREIEGSYALLIMIRDFPDLMIIAKKGSPLLIGLCEGGNMVASDYNALSDFTKEVIFLNDDEFALIHKNEVQLFDEEGHALHHDIKVMDEADGDVSKDGYEHYMLKEIYEQPRVVMDNLHQYVDLQNYKIHLPNFPFDLAQINKITIVACGTSYYSGMVAKYLIEEIANVEVEVDIASEFRYRSHPFREDNLMIFISQSGETADSLAALKYAKEHNQKIMSIVNVAQSSMAQLSDVIIKTMAGPEIGVASTKAYTAQVSCLSIFAVALGLKKRQIIFDQAKNYLDQIKFSSDVIEDIISDESIEDVKRVANYLKDFPDILYVGRGVSYVTAMESALKLRELSYLNAQAIAAGELKHGTIALIDKNMPIVALAFDNNLFEKIASNIQEIKAREGIVISICDNHTCDVLRPISKHLLQIKKPIGSIQEAITGVIFPQLIAYYVALFKGNDVDQPRNLAKSVTVE